MQWSSNDFQWFSKWVQWFSTGCILVSKKHDRKHYQKLSMRLGQTTHVTTYVFHMFAMVLKWLSMVFPMVFQESAMVFSWFPMIFKMVAMAFNRLPFSQQKKHDRKHHQKLSMRRSQTTNVMTYAFHMFAMVLKWLSMVFPMVFKNVQWSSIDFQ